MHMMTIEEDNHHVHEADDTALQIFDANRIANDSARVSDKVWETLDRDGRKGWASVAPATGPQRDQKPDWEWYQRWKRCRS